MSNAETQRATQTTQTPFVVNKDAQTQTPSAKQFNIVEVQTDPQPLPFKAPPPMHLRVHATKAATEAFEIQEEFEQQPPSAIERHREAIERLFEATTM